MHAAVRPPALIKIPRIRKQEDNQLVGLVKYLLILKLATWLAIFTIPPYVSRNILVYRIMVTFELVRATVYFVAVVTQLRWISCVPSPRRST